MQAALIAMTILGCDDSVRKCSYVATVDKHWSTVELCNTDLERQLKRYMNVSFPTIIGVCEAPTIATTAEALQQPPQNSTAEPKSGINQPSNTETPQSFASRVAGQVRNRLPSSQGVREALSKPVRFVSDGYSWIVRRLN